MKRTFLSLAPLLLLISIPALRAAEPATTPPEPPPLISPASPLQSSAPADQVGSPFPAPLAGAVWLSCTQVPDQNCYELYCAGYPACIDCYAIYCSGGYFGCQCDWIP